MQKRAKLVSVVIPTRNRQRDTIECLGSLFQVEYPHYEVIVVDNASTDGTAAAVRKAFPQVKLVENERDLWAAGGRNAGLKHARGDYIFFLDSDNILDGQCLRELVRFMESDPTLGIVGPKMYYYDEPTRICYAGADISLVTGKTTYVGLNQFDRGQYESARQTGHVPNAFLVSKKVIEAIGGFDESYVMFYEESDFAMRASKRGFKVIYCPKATVWHKVPPPVPGPFTTLGLGSSAYAYYAARNRVIYMKRHARLAAFLVFLVSFFPASIFFYAWHMLGLRRYDILKAYLKGSWDGLIYGITGRLRDRENRGKKHT
ncbi:rhamnosyltransferase [Candidatus Hakubella thermalkaliphila]|uniref:Rhamnosyltransferase n=2 Tax=Candidatus Hakubella thermalkaliphila TaxID=2754717 RepID=A0A6V8Q8S1_9ACTN|nr:rhamnosyltransferase [Candidatus Hakubella thermalkaliphila]GFP40933.1 rhamnosyltransferase [Candidatus Hakubella thermalkaliphila]